MCLSRIAERLEISSGALHCRLSKPRFGTMGCEHTRSTLPSKGRRLAHLCEHFGVEFNAEAAHDARYDPIKLAQCVAEAARRGVMLKSAEHVDPDVSV